jgi:hypothetical protein
MHSFAATDLSDSESKIGATRSHLGHDCDVWLQTRSGVALAQSDGHARTSAQCHEPVASRCSRRSLRQMLERGIGQLRDRGGGWFASGKATRRLSSLEWQNVGAGGAGGSHERNATSHKILPNCMSLEKRKPGNGLNGRMVLRSVLRPLLRDWQRLQLRRDKWRSRVSC